MPFPLPAIHKREGVNGRTASAAGRASARRLCRGRFYLPAHAIVCVCVRRLCVPIWQALRDAETAVARASPACSALASDAGA